MSVCRTRRIVPAREHRADALVHDVLARRPDSRAISANGSSRKPAMRSSEIGEDARVGLVADVRGEQWSRVMEFKIIAAARSRRSTMRTVVPSPSTLATAISPPQLSTSRRLIARPSPLPLVRVEKCGSNIRGSTLARNAAAVVAHRDRHALRRRRPRAPPPDVAPARRAFSSRLSSTSRSSSSRAYAITGVVDRRSMRQLDARPRPAARAPPRRARPRSRRAAPPAARSAGAMP